MTEDKALFRDKPFPHAILGPVLTNSGESKALYALEQVVWERRSASFYRFDIPADDRIRSDILDLIIDEMRLLDNLSWLEAMFECRLSTDVRIEVHRYCRGDGIGPHTDAGTAEVRCVLNLNRGWEINDGGIWVLAGDSALRSDTTYLPSLSNTGFAFSTCISSFHALSQYDNIASYGIAVRIPRIDRI